MGLSNIFTSNFEVYNGTVTDISRSFELTHKGSPIFQKYFNGSDPSIVSVGSSIIKIENHFFVTGEKVSYSPGSPRTSSPIGIALTDFGVGIGTTDKLPNYVYIIKVDDNYVKLARNVDDALRIKPKPLNISSVGIGTQHSFTSENKNSKILVSIDNVIQSPLVSTAITTKLTKKLTTVDDFLYTENASNFFIGDLVRIDGEIMKVDSVGVGTTNCIKVSRAWAGTNFEKHINGSLVKKLNGNYNIVNNTLNFVEPPYGNVPFGTSTNSPDERDWEGISRSSSFHGRVFMRSGVTDTSNEPYYKNYIFDDISSGFSGEEKTFTLKSNGENIEDITEENAIILVNEIFQSPGVTNNYTLSEYVGINSITFVGTATSLSSDINTSNLPFGGVIVSVGSTSGFGYQPLVSAGATAVVSSAGTISSIVIGNGGSGYRTEIDTPSGTIPITIKVGVALSSLEEPLIEFIGTAAVSNGSIVSVAITNPGIGYTTSNLPYVVIDSPLSYSDIPLSYSSNSSGIGTKATIDIVVGQGSSIIEFEIKNTGYGYNVGDILTIPTGGPTGIPTISGSYFEEFQISIQRVDNDKFSGWSIGELQIFDNIQTLFDGRRKVFPLVYQGERISIYAKKGSPINIQDNLLVFVNDILQIPGEGYIFNGGSRIEFTEALKPEDTCKILFYKGSGDDVDVIFKNIIETVKVGDELTILNDSLNNQTISLLEDPRYPTDVLSIDAVETNPYFGPGNTSDSSLTRPVVWCKQTEDKIFNEFEVNKSRLLYEPQIQPTTYIIQPVGIGSSVIFVESLRPFFNPSNESPISGLNFQKNITLISQDIKVSASATAIVSEEGIISSIDIIDGGFGYKNPPNVIIQNPIGTQTNNLIVSSSITSGIVTSISIVGIASGYSSENPPQVLIEPPVSEIEVDKVRSYSGDFGNIVGFGITASGGFYKVIFDLYIPQDSVLRDSTISGSATTISSLSVGDFFIVNNSNVGLGSTNIISLGLDGSLVGVSKTFVDTVFQVSDLEIVQNNIIGIGTTFVKRVYSNISGLGTNNFSSSIITFDSTSYTFDISDSYSAYSGTISTSKYFGDYSWGKIVVRSRSKDLQFNYYGNNGSSGIITSSIVTRSVPLKYTNYVI